jgi:predicted GNAT family N-acyltransferase
MNADFTVREASWEVDAEKLQRVRQQVFVEEQGVSPEEEWDGLDAQCRHIIAEDRAGNPIGTARLTPDARVGRMAVLKSWRNRGVGRALLKTAVELARRCGWRRLCAHAQVQAAGFYARQGFLPEGGQFWEAGILHQKMVREIDR